MRPLDFLREQANVERQFDNRFYTLKNRKDDAKIFKS
jgi:hypothetical protein